MSIPTNFALRVLTALAFVFLVACGSDNDDDASTGGSSPEQGQFVDSAVGGLSYISSAASGLTDGEGWFDYASGDIVDFFIGGPGGINLGSAAGGAFVMPMDLVPEGAASDRVGVNIARLLIGLDSDSDAANGLTIDNEAYQAASTLALDAAVFDHEPADFPPAELADFVQSQITDKGRSMPSEAEARSHIQCSNEDIEAGRDPDGICDDADGNNNGGSDDNGNDDGGNDNGGDNEDDKDNGDNSDDDSNDDDGEDDDDGNDDEPVDEARCDPSDPSTWPVCAAEYGVPVPEESGGCAYTDPTTWMTCFENFAGGGSGECVPMDPGTWPHCGPDDINQICGYAGSEGEFPACLSGAGEPLGGGGGDGCAPADPTTWTGCGPEDLDQICAVLGAEGSFPTCLASAGPGDPGEPGGECDFTDPVTWPNCRPPTACSDPAGFNNPGECQATATEMCYQFAEEFGTGFGGYSAANFCDGLAAFPFPEECGMSGLGDPMACRDAWVQYCYDYDGYKDFPGGSFGEPFQETFCGFFSNP